MGGFHFSFSLHHWSQIKQKCAVLVKQKVHKTDAAGQALLFSSVQPLSLNKHKEIERKESSHKIIDWPICLSVWYCFLIFQSEDICILEFCAKIVKKFLVNDRCQRRFADLLWWMMVASGIVICEHTLPTHTCILRLHAHKHSDRYINTQINAHTHKT